MTGGTVFALQLLREWQVREFVAVFALLMCVYGYAAWRLFNGKTRSSADERRMLFAIVIVAAVMRVTALFAPTTLSTDAFRYVWDGRVQAAGINPYRYVPADPALSGLRDASIFPNINRATYAHTIYPPTAQIAFLAIERLSDSITGMKLGMLAFDAVSIACLIRLLRGRGLPPSRVLLYAWHPLPVWEFAGSGHVDAVAIAFLLLAFLAAMHLKPAWAGAALAAATLVKFYPAVAGPALYRRWDWRLPAAFAATVVLLYLPYLSVGEGVFGFLSGYIREEGMSRGDGIFLWSLLQLPLHLPENALRYFGPFAALILAALSLWIQFGKRREDTDGALLLASAFTVLVSPHDPWYFTWLVPFLCFRWSLAHLWLTAACTLMYVLPYPTGLTAQASIYVPFLCLLLLQFLFRRHTRHPETFHANPARHASRA